MYYDIYCLAMCIDKPFINYQKNVLRDRGTRFRRSEHIYKFVVWNNWQNVNSSKFFSSF